MHGCLNFEHGYFSINEFPGSHLIRKDLQYIHSSSGNIVTRTNYNKLTKFGNAQNLKVELHQKLNGVIYEVM